MIKKAPNQNASYRKRPDQIFTEPVNALEKADGSGYSRRFDSEKPVSLAFLNSDLTAAE
jgi:hypothetical protein